MNSAIKLEPKKADYFVNRAFLKYNLDDYFGAMADFDYAIELDPSNVPARFNRGLLRMEVQDDNKAIEDFSYVLEREPDNFMALYNRATLYQQTRQYKLAIADYDKVIERYRICRWHILQAKASVCRATEKEENRIIISPENCTKSRLHVNML